MLDLMRKHARSWLIKVALGGIIIVFVFWYGWSGPEERTSNFAAKVNDTEISTNQFQMVYQSELEKLRLRFKGQIPPELLDKLNLKEKIAQGLVDQILMLEEARRLGLFVTDQDLVWDIRSNPIFLNNGAFDERIYRMYLTSIKLAPAAYEDMRRKELLQLQLAHLLTDSVKTSPEEIKRLWHFQNDRLVLSVLLVKPQKETKTPDTGAVESYFKKNQTKYEIPASVDVKYVVFSWRDIAKGLSVSDDEARSYYGSHPKEFIVPERTHARHILLKVPPDADATKREEIRKKAEEIFARIKMGEDFSKVAEAESQDEATAKKGGDLGYFSKGTMNPELEKAASALAMGAVSEPVLTDQGYEILKVDEKQPEKEVPFDLAKDKIVSKILEEKARNKAERVADDFYEQVYRSEDMEGQSAKFGFTVSHAEMVPRSGELPKVGQDPKLMDEIFRLQPNEVGKLLRVGDNFVIAKLVKKNKERIPDFSEVQKTAEKDYLDYEARQNARKKAREIIEALKEHPEKAEETAKESGLSWQQLEPVSRTAGFIPQLGSSPEISEMLTSVSPAAPLYTEAIPVQGGMAVVRLAKTEPAGEDKFEKDASAFEKWVLEVRKTDFLKGWVRLLREKATINVNPKLL